MRAVPTISHPPAVTLTSPLEGPDEDNYALVDMDNSMFRNHSPESGYQLRINTPDLIAGGYERRSNHLQVTKPHVQLTHQDTVESHI